MSEQWTEKELEEHIKANFDYYSAVVAKKALEERVNALMESMND